MKTIEIKDIKNLFQNELRYLNKALINTKNLYHTFTLGTINKNQCETRTVVLRNVQANPLKIYFNADYRSPKVKQLLDNSNCSALFYDVSRRVQQDLKQKLKFIIRTKYLNLYGKKHLSKAENVTWENLILVNLLKIGILIFH